MKLPHPIPLLAAAFVASSLLSSCMTIIQGTRERIIINRDTTEPVSILTADDTLTFQGQSFEVSVKKKHLNRPIQLQSENYVYEAFIPGRSIDWFGVCADACFYTVGLALDFANGAIYHPAQSTYYVSAVPRDSASTTLPLKDYRVPSVFKPKDGKTYHHELRLGANFGNFMNKASYNRMYDRTCQTLGLEEYNTWYCGLGAVVNVSASLSYFYHLDPHWAVGLIAGTGRQPYEELGHTVPASDARQDYSEQWYDGDMLARSWYFLPAVKLHWAFFNGSRLYSKVGLGAMNQHNWFHCANPDIPNANQMNERRWHPAYQISPLCIEAGKGFLRFYGELGAGMEGIVNMGFSFYF
ncbi:MAG: hypothetical protein IJ570_02365 [Prevotella sp.]|nr:hypothetical protein [Prevotella sp.]